MKNRFLIRTYNDIEFFKPVQSFLEKLCEIVSFPRKERDELIEAVWELFENAVEHAYEKDEEGIIEIECELFHNGIKVDVKDKGLPFDPKILQQVPLDLKEKNRGLNRVYLLVDSFKYFNLGLGGKKFSVIKYVPLHLRLQEDIPFYSDIGDDLDRIAKEHLKDRLVVRSFQEGDEVGIARLIYKNYGYTYFKDIFYFPEKIVQKERSGAIHSIVAQVEDKIVGHFALVIVPNSNTAEIGIAVVDPKFKGMGIMKAMFEKLIQKAKELHLSALFGEAITFHPYSQKANARFGFVPTALQLGELHQMVRLKGHKYPFRDTRGAAVVEYLVFNRAKRKIFIPKRYKDWIEKTYALCQVPFEIAKKAKEKEQIAVEHNPAFNIATIVIDGAKGFEKRATVIFEEAVKKHPDMVYADICLASVANIDEVVEALRKLGFFYCGVLFLRRNEKDYLRMQLELAENIEEQNIVCYSDFCKALHQFILLDKRDV
ncbi:MULTISPECIES: GNAT family N-acetyltransferase [unclassified Nitratiruptor]|uniref:GNAT family N-acetyltransferase n=1 Tax=unclassified Nitratiruptor TaxID=2624044 RepID=UPI00191627E0|nr:MULTISPECIES: GNAT family N-acetyltransferase [unclassified Nitratiruptor]BCD61045.1 hypothetical protein NitYY0810_C1826 [Nitratiruptor sp. YY08-10]BCD64977.1 hypothetical protein NitYY0814_C1834 [Nitratiruptor sp. YY08-14]